MASLKISYNKYNLLRQIPLFSNLNWLERRFIASRLEFKEYKKKDIVYRQNEPGDAFYCLVSGRLLAYFTDAHGHQHNVEYLYRGMYFGIVSVLTGDPHSLTFEALNDSVVICIPKDQFNEILKRIPRLGIEISYSLSKRLRRQDGRDKLILESTVISVYSPFRGIGSSFYAFNLAFHLKNETKKKVLFVDFLKGSERNFLSSMDAVSAPEWRYAPVRFSDVVSDRELLVKSILKTDHGVELLHVSFETQGRDLSAYVSEFISTLANDYHYIILDLPNSADDIVFKTLMQSDDVHLVLGQNPDEILEGKEMIARLRVSFCEPAGKNRLKVLIREFHENKPLGLGELSSLFSYPVFAKLPQVMPKDPRELFSSSHPEIFVPSSETLFFQRMRSLAREFAKVQIGLALGGGAAYGLSLIGVLRILEKEKVPPDIIAGSSIGALIGSLWALGYTADEIEKFASEFRKKVLCFNLLDIIFPRSGLIGGRNITRWLRRKIGQKTFADTKIPLKVLAYDIVQHEELVIDEGDIVDAVRQSIGIPGFIRPVIRQGRVIIDGGFVNPVPTNVLTALGVQKIIAVNVMKSPDDVARDIASRHRDQEILNAVRFHRSPIQFLKIKVIAFFRHLWFPNIFDIIVESFQSAGHVLAEQSAQQADVLIHPDLTGVDWYELYKVDRLIASGEAAAQAKIEELRQLIRRI